jgi:hypothetical protein
VARNALKTLTVDARTPFRIFRFIPRTWTCDGGVFSGVVTAVVEWCNEPPVAQSPEAFDKLNPFSAIVNLAGTGEATLEPA